MKTQQHDAIVLSSNPEKEAQASLVSLLRECPVPDDEILANLGLFLTSKNLSRLLFFYELYQRIVTTHGVIFEFGVRWGQTLSLLAALRGILEPFNRHRKIVGFDTFAGFRGISAADGSANRCADGSFSVPAGYEGYLERILADQEALNPASHLRKFELVKGDAAETVQAYCQRHPETLVSMAIFDFDIYAPTKVALEAIRPHLFRGSILVFDELCDDIFPGETVALREVLGLRDLRIQRLPMTSRISFVELE
jgi:hypothetical protein